MAEAGKAGAYIGPSDVVTEGITIRPHDLAAVRAILRACLPKAAKVFVFGSRARGTNKRAADLDLAIDAGRALSLSEHTALEVGFEDSSLPYRVDIADMRTISAAFKAIIAPDMRELDWQRQG